jgi:hypothetical protein
MINPHQVGAPLSKYLYGPFIENPGKSIYSEVQAGMIIDCKFYFSITDTYYPWGIVEPGRYCSRADFPV